MGSSDLLWYESVFEAADIVTTTNKREHLVFRRLGSCDTCQIIFFNRHRI